MAHGLKFLQGIEMDSKTLLAFALMILIYMFFFAPKPNAVRQPIATNSIEQTATPDTRSDAKRSNLSAEEGQSKLRAQTYTLKNEKVSLTLNGLGEIQSAEFLKFKSSTSKANEVFAFNGQPIQFSSLQVSGTSPKFEILSSDDRHINLISKSDALEVHRSVELSQSNYQLTITDEIKNRGSKSVVGTLSASLFQITPRNKAGGCGAMFGPQAEIQELVYMIDGKATRTPLYKINESSPVEKQEVISWGGVSHKYFFLGLVPENSSVKSIKANATAINGSNDLKTNIELSLNEKQITPGETASFRYSFFVGPKELNELSVVQPELHKAIDYGDWIGPIARFLLSILHFFYSLIPNYGIAIILLTILVKLALFPLAKKSAISMKRLQQVQPKMKEIRERYKDDKQRINLETMKLYKEEKVNPVGGCLPLLIQMPVFFALYRVFYASIELRQAPFFGWIRDLAVHDPYFVTPVLMTALMWYQQKMTPQPPADEDNEAVKMQRSMMKWMPIFFGAIMIFLPAGLTLYFLVSSLITILQTAYLNKKLHTHVAPVGI